MRKIDKKLNMMKANLLAESRYLESKGLLTENISGPQKTDPDIEELAKAIFKETERFFPDMKAVYDAQKNLIKSTANGNEEIRDKLVDAVGAMTSKFKSGLIELSESEIDEYDYRRLNQDYGTLEPDRKEKINQFAKNRQATYGIKMKGFDTDLTAFLSPRLSNDIICRSFKTSHIPDLNNALSFANKLYAQQHNDGNKPVYIQKDDETYKFYTHQANFIFDIDLKNNMILIKGYKNIDGVELEFNLPNTLVNFKTNSANTNQETKDIELVAIGTLVKNNDKINPPFTYNVTGIKTELGLIPSSAVDANKLINIIKETIKNKYKFELNKLFISDVIIKKEAFSKGNF